MDFGVILFPTDETIAPADIARAAEERGFESLWFCEHSHIPVGRATPYPAGGELPRHYFRTLDPFVALAAAATATQRLRIGSGVCLVVERDPIMTAKEVASVDLLSGGRLLFGIGAGWNREEMANHGTDPRTRLALLRERVLAMKAIWAGDQAEFHGDYVDFDPIYQWPKPVQRPHPPILVGGNGPTTLQRVVEYGDGWMPNRIEPDALAERIAELGRMAEAAGRDPIPVTIFGGQVSEEAITRCAEIGVSRYLFMLRSEPPDEVMVTLDHRATLVESFA